jgi:hypothetical protein
MRRCVAEQYKHTTGRINMYHDQLEDCIEPRLLVTTALGWVRNAFVKNVKTIEG